jgi:hypothetical protein
VRARARPPGTLQPNINLNPFREKGKKEMWKIGFPAKREKSD